MPETKGRSPDEIEEAFKARGKGKAPGRERCFVRRLRLRRRCPPPPPPPPPHGLNGTVGAGWLAGRKQGPESSTYARGHGGADRPPNATNDDPVISFLFSLCFFLLPGELELVCPHRADLQGKGSARSSLLHRPPRSRSSSTGQAHTRAGLPKPRGGGFYCLGGQGVRSPGGANARYSLSCS